MQDGRARPALLHVPHRGGQWPASGTRVPRKEFLNERMHTCAQLCPLWVLPAGVPFSAPSVLTPFSSIIATPASPGAPRSPPQPLSPRAGLPTTGRRAPFPPPARHTSGRTAVGTSTRLGTAEDGEERGRGMLADLSGRGQAANPGERKQGAEREAGRWEKVEAGATGN